MDVTGCAHIFLFCLAAGIDGLFIGSVYLFIIYLVFHILETRGGAKRGKVYFVDVSKQMACTVPA